ncbi:hypothetical protein KQ944_18400 [Bacillus subtilis]|uniref:hypothetical protein n=1 Tax=Pseudochrobactrum asaccharolyticum TaxID=354351 RepID=UPI001F30D016|nr:hypothetical protein [Pseudochrobactrum asaccharolyticum]MCF7647321.1 hypothetical protein [Pseudochrobactrum asaccharolyticum]MCF7673612.1 hypothetical protein [Bacillus subtilis]
MIESAKYTKYGSIIAVIDGQEMTVPDDMANRHRIMLAKWEAEGNAIAPYVEPILTPEEQRAQMPPITKRQLRLTLVRNGISLGQVEQSIAAMPDGLEKQEAEIEWQDASQFNRLHPTLLLVATALSLTPEQIDAMWETALTV